MKNLSLDELLDANQLIYVRNTAIQANIMLILQFKDGYGKPHPLPIHPTPIPICISHQFSAQSIREAHDLRKAIERGVLRLVDPETAKKELESSEAQEELQAIQLSAYSDLNPNSVTRDALAAMKDKVAPVVEAGTLLKASAQEGIADPISGRLKGIVASFKSGEKNSKESLQVLKRLKTTLNASELRYIVQECKEDTSIREFAESLMAAK